MREFVVRVVQTWYPADTSGRPSEECADEGGHISFSFLMALEQAGSIVQHAVDPNGLTRCCFDILPPRYNAPNSYQWAEENAAAMRAAGFNAVVAPGTNS